jgi:hypothetical protein
VSRGASLPLCLAQSFRPVEQSVSDLKFLQGQFDAQAQP